MNRMPPNRPLFVALVAILSCVPIFGEEPSPSATLGITVEDKSAADARLTRSGSPSLSNRKCVVISSVDPNGPAAGKLRVDTAITSVNGTATPDVKTFQVIVNSLTPGSEIDVKGLYPARGEGGKPRWAVGSAKVTAIEQGSRPKAPGTRTKGSAPDSIGTKTVEVTGTGADVENAKKDAYREAVRQVVGLYTTSQTRIENDELIEDEIISLSSGFVEKATVLKEDLEQGVVHVTMRCTVRSTKVLDKLKAHQVAIMKVDGQSLGAELLGRADQEQGSARLIAKAFEGFPAAWFNAQVRGTPRLGSSLRNGHRELLVTVVLNADLEAFSRAAAQISEAIKASGAPSVDFVVDGSRYPLNNADSLAGQLAHSFLPHNSEDHLNAEMISGLDLGATSSGWDLVRRLENSASRPARFNRLMLPTRFSADGRRSDWVAYLCTQNEPRRIQLACNDAAFICRLVLLDTGGDTIASHTLTISPERCTLCTNGSLLIPGWIVEDGFRGGSIGSIAMTVTFELSEAELTRLGTVTASVENLSTQSPDDTGAE